MSGLGGLGEAIAARIRERISSGDRSGLAWGPRIFRDASGPCVNCRAGTSAGARRAPGGLFVRLCGTCWRGAGGEVAS